MSGLLALLDDVAGIAKVAAASVDDVAAHAAKAGAKAAGAVIDDAAVTPKYVTGFDASREIPIVWRIAKGSIFNKVVILLPIALLLSSFAPWAIAPLLMLGGAYLCFEGAEKILHALQPDHAEVEAGPVDAVGLEESRVKGAIKTDFILSAEIMTIALSTIPTSDSVIMKAAILLLVAFAITAAVYGFVALIVKADDVGLHMATHDDMRRPIGRGIVHSMPYFMKVLMIVGTAAMIWVGGNIVIHSLSEMGLTAPYQWIAKQAGAIAAVAPASLAGVTRWFATAAMDGVIGLAIGMALVPVATKLIMPVWANIAGNKA